MPEEFSFNGVWIPPPSIFPVSPFYSQSMDGLGGAWFTEVHLDLLTDARWVGEMGPPFQVSEQTADSFPGLEFAQAGTPWEEGHPKAVALSGQELLLFAQLHVGQWEAWGRRQLRAWVRVGSNRAFVALI